MADRILPDHPFLGPSNEHLLWYVNHEPYWSESAARRRMRVNALGIVGTAAGAGVSMTGVMSLSVDSALFISSAFAFALFVLGGGLAIENWQAAYSHVRWIRQVRDALQ